IVGVGLLVAGESLSHYLLVLPPKIALKEAAAAPIEEHQDRYGDPLPPGALARLGTVRQRAPDSQLAVTADGKEIVTFSHDSTFRRFDVQTGALRAVRSLPEANAWGLLNWLSPRGTFALTAGISGAGKYHLNLWELSQGKVRHSLSLPGIPWGAAFSAN